MDLVSRVTNITMRPKEEWPVILKMLKLTDQNLYRGIARKMLNHLCWSSIPEAEHYLQSMSLHGDTTVRDDTDDWNRPRQKLGPDADIDVSAAAFKIASDHLSDDEILELIQRWIQEDKLSFIAQVVNGNLSQADVADAIRRYNHHAEQ